MNKWDNLSPADKAHLIQIFVSNGINDIGTMRDKYNEFEEGGGMQEVEKINNETRQAELNYFKWNSKSDTAKLNALISRAASEEERSDIIEKALLGDRYEEYKQREAARDRLRSVIDYYNRPAKPSLVLSQDIVDKITPSFFGGEGRSEFRSEYNDNTINALTGVNDIFGNSEGYQEWEEYNDHQPIPFIDSDSLSPSSFINKVSDTIINSGNKEAMEEYFSNLSKIITDPSNNLQKPIIKKEANIITDESSSPFNEFSDGGEITSIDDLRKLGINSREEYIAYKADTLRRQAHTNSLSRKYPSAPIERYIYDYDENDEITKVPVYGHSCIYTATDNYGTPYKVSGNGTFYDNPAKYGFEKIDEKDILPGDLVQLQWYDYPVPYHAMIYNGRDKDGAYTFNYSIGDANPYSETAIRKEHKYPLSTTEGPKDRYLFYRFTGRDKDKKTWGNEYDSILSKYYQEHPKPNLTELPEVHMPVSVEAMSNDDANIFDGGGELNSVAPLKDAVNVETKDTANQWLNTNYFNKMVEEGYEPAGQYVRDIISKGSSEVDVDNKMIDGYLKYYATEDEKKKFLPYSNSYFNGRDFWFKGIDNYDDALVYLNSKEVNVPEGMYSPIYNTGIVNHYFNNRHNIVYDEALKLFDTVNSNIVGNTSTRYKYQPQFQVNMDPDNYFRIKSIGPNKKPTNVHTLKANKDLLNYLYDEAVRGEQDPKAAIAIALQESMLGTSKHRTTGNIFDILSYWNGIGGSVFTNSTFKEASDSSNTYIKKYMDGTLTMDDLQGIRDTQKIYDRQLNALHPYTGTNVVADAVQYFNDGKYNPGEKDHTTKVMDRFKELLYDKNFKEWWDQREKERLGTK